MVEENRLPDDAVVVRCGVPPFLARPLHLSCDEHPAGCYGFSVQSAAGLSAEELARNCQNRMALHEPDAKTASAAEKLWENFQDSFRFRPRDLRRRKATFRR